MQSLWSRVYNYIVAFILDALILYLYSYFVIILLGSGRNFLRPMYLLKGYLWKLLYMLLVKGMNRHFSLVSLNGITQSQM